MNHNNFQDAVNHFKDHPDQFPQFLKQFNLPGNTWREVEMIASLRRGSINPSNSPNSHYDNMSKLAFGLEEPSVEGVKEFIAQVRKRSLSETILLAEKRDIIRLLNYWKFVFGSYFVFEKQKCGLKVSRSNFAEGAFQVRATVSPQKSLYINDTFPVIDIETPPQEKSS